MKRVLIPLAILLACIACKKEKETPVSGDITLSSKLVLDGQYFTRGYSFDEAVFLPFPGTSASRVDLLVFTTTDDQGGVNGAYLTSPSNIDSAYCKTGSFNTLEEATSYWNGHKLIECSSFMENSDLIHPFEIWNIHTGRETYARILVKAIHVVSDPDGDFVEVDLKWEYQPNGTKQF
jgi:hypothetical protein